MLLYVADRYSNGKKPRFEYVGVTTNDLCPVCGRRGIWRHGVYFDHERRCPIDNSVWVPGERGYLVKVPAPPRKEVPMSDRKDAMPNPFVPSRDI